jgi:hypothetical protein
MSRLDTTIQHGNLNVRIRHGGGVGFADVARLAALGAVAYAVVTAILAALVAIAVALVTAAVLAAAALAVLWRWQAGRNAVVAAKLQAGRELREAEDARREELRHQRRLEIAAASAPKIVIDAGLLAAAAGAQLQPARVIHGEVER